MYKELVEVSKFENNERYKNGIFINKEAKLVYATNGSSLFVDRGLFNQVAGIARLLDSDALVYNDKTDTLDKDTKATPIITDFIKESQLTDRKKFSVTLPEWLGSVSKKEKKPLITFNVEGKTPSITLGGKGITFNAKLLRTNGAKNVDMYVKGEKDPAYILPQGKTLDNAEWFYIVMPIVNNEVEETIKA